MKHLRETLEKCWARETSSMPDQWMPDNPARGQCAVTSLVAQDYIGGSLMRGIVNGESHYWNLDTETGTEFDWTIQQFATPLICRELPVIRDRAYVLSFPDTARRYALLRLAVEDAL